MNGEANSNPYNPHYLHCCEQAVVNPDSAAMQKIYVYAYREHHSHGLQDVASVFEDLIDLFKEVRG